MGRRRGGRGRRASASASRTARSAAVTEAFDCRHAAPASCAAADLSPDSPVPNAVVEETAWPSLVRHSLVTDSVAEVTVQSSLVCHSLATDAVVK